MEMQRIRTLRRLCVSDSSALHLFRFVAVLLMKCGRFASLTKFVSNTVNGELLVVAALCQNVCHSGALLSIECRNGRFADCTDDAQKFERNCWS